VESRRRRGNSQASRTILASLEFHRFLKLKNTQNRDFLSYKPIKRISKNPHKSMQNMNIISYNMQIC
jgi:hypothetical protein